MPPLPYGFVKDLQEGKSKFAIRLRVVHLYEKPQYQNKTEIASMECVLHDEKGERVHASIPKRDIDHFKQILKVGSVFAILKYAVGQSTMRNRSTECVFRILLYKYSIITPVNLDLAREFPSMMYNFKSFDEILTIKNSATSTLFDVIGAIVSTSKPQLKDLNGSATRLMEVVLEDNKGTTLPCTLWEEYISQLTKYLLKEPKNPVVIIIQFCKPTIYRGEVKVSSSYHISSIVYDESDKHIQAFTESYLKEGRSGTIQIHSVSEMDLKPTPSLEDLDLKIPCSNINEIKNYAKIGYYWIYAEIINIEDICGWSYLACKKCCSKLLPDDDKFFCKKCESFDVEGRMR